MTFIGLYFMSEVMVKLARRVRGHSVTLTEVSMHLIECNHGHISHKRYNHLHFSS